MSAHHKKQRSAKATAQRFEELTLDIATVDEDGCGVASHEGKPVQVFDALPGEKVLARVVHRGRNRISAATVRVLTASPARTRANPCPHFRGCQGCALLNWSYPAQLAAKKERVEQAMADYPVLQSAKVNETWAAAEPFGYRASAKLVVAKKRGKGLVGLYRRGTHEVVDIAECPLHHPLINRIASVVRDELSRNTVSAYDPRHGRGLLRYLLVRVSPAYGKAMVTFVVSQRNYRELTHLAKWLQRKVPEVISIHQNVNASSGNVIIGRETIKMLGMPDLIDLVGDVRLRLGPTSFLQVNHNQAERIYRLVNDWCSLRPGEAALDLYCGVGGISLHLAARGGQILGMESVVEAVRHAQANARMNGFTNCQFIAGDVEQLLTGEATLPERLGAIVLNPPRGGCSAEVISAVSELHPRVIVYVSCHPASLARDLAQLVSNGYGVAEVQPVDMFPQTPHIESVVRLVAG